MDIIIKQDCPKCKQTNWVNDGDAEDFTLPDCEAIECWNCQYIFLTPAGEEMVQYEIKGVEDCFSQSGKQNL